MINKVILQLTGMDSRHYGAKEHYFVNLAQLCCQKGYRLILQYESLPLSSAYLSDLEESDTEVVVIATHDNLLRSIPRVAALIRSTRPEIIETHFVNSYHRFIAPIIAQMVGTRKRIAFVRNVSHKKNSKKRFIYNRYNQIFTISKAIGDELIEFGVNPKIISTHYLGLFGNREKSQALRTQYRNEFNIPDQATVISVIAFDTPFKGLDILLEAFAQIASRHSCLHLLIIGVEDSQSTLPELADKLGISTCVHWAGIRDEGWQLLNAADIYVQPSRHSEGLGMAIVEAMALKLPTVGTYVGGIPEAIIDGETGYLAEPESVDSLAEKLECLVGEPSKRLILGEAGYKRYLQIFEGKTQVSRHVEQYFK